MNGLCSPFMSFPTSVLVLFLADEQLDTLPRLKAGFFCEDGFQLVHFVAYGSGFLELKVMGGILHLLFHLADDLLQFTLRGLVMFCSIFGLRFAERHGLFFRSR